MISSGISPIHNLWVDGNVLVDVILNDGSLFVRLIDYRSYHNTEILFRDDSGLEEVKYSKGTKKLVVKGLRYCRVMAGILSLENLSSNAKRIHELITQEGSININRLHERTELPEKEVVLALDEILAKKMITRMGYQRYAVDDQFGHIRKMFDPKKNRFFIS